MSRLAAAVALGLVLPVAAAAGLEWDGGLQQHRLVETTIEGRSFVRERGLGPALGVAWQSSMERPDAWGLRASIASWAARADYDGQTQSGQPIVSHTDTQSVSLRSLLLRGFGASGWRGEIGLEAEWFRRRINPVGANAGLDERLVQPRGLVALQWSDERWSVRMGAAAGSRGPLSVRFDGAVLETITLRSGRSRGVSLDVGHAWDARWKLGAGLERTWVDESERATVSQAGQPVGTVVQPRWRRDRLQLTVQHRFD